ncbi:DNA topoisomerase I [Candidatus Woesearchaeota archaeon]|jgi:DNA topoisomerase I|nr:DNA topoisomerase I [Candidatus Woesearchaeota archaeon]MBT4150685.1 DNA topoisomerase I [Candidatus Woesearchaeota archaeon]MBT4434327.1 DNA topoisomerase I [Candidatus Woesearchaeota archaeon]MBT7332284.1 DNA topoisomerase I [Candidatus Woesearchaeota archaeon]
MELIITEKPSSAKKVAAALADGSPKVKKNKQSSYFELTHNGKEIIVTSAVGHLYGLVEANKNGWTYPTFDIKWEASYKNAKGLAYVKVYLDTITKLAKEADEFTIATDFDVEGEVIGLNVIRFACKKKDANRMKFSTLTKGDLVKSYDEKMKTLDWGQALAGETRHKLDWFYGINLSRALTSSVKAAGSFKVMSAGRVQGPALKMLVDREREIQAFVPVPFWEIPLLGDFKKNDIEAQHKDGKIFDESKVDTIMESVKGQSDAKVTEVKRTKRNQAPPNPFNLTSLQSEAYGQFKITPKETLALAQTLYLGGVTSYPRTSSQKLDPKLGFKKILTDLAKQPHYQGLCNELLKGELKPNDGKKTDPAHPAIYPTGLAPGELKPREQKIYDLIVKRFMATFAKPAVRETMEVFLDVNKEVFITKGTRTIEENWHVFYKPYVRLEEVSLPDMKENDLVDIKSIKKVKKETQPPKRYNQSSIIKELEKRNLGTKATRADILDRLFIRGYVEGVKILVTKLGMETISILEKFAPTIVDEKLTADFEEDMQQIREGKQEQEKVLEKAKKTLTVLLTDFKKKEKEIGKEILASVRETQDIQNFMGRCPKCKEGSLMIRRGKFGRFVGCGKYPDCKTIINIPKTGVVKFTGKMDDETGWPIASIGTGRKKQDVILQPADKNAPVEKKYPEQDMTCPTCNVGKMVLRKSYYGEFLGCNNYPKCQTLMNIKDGKVDTEKPIVRKPAEKKAKKKVAKKKPAKKKAVKKK